MPHRDGNNIKAIVSFTRSMFDSCSYTPGLFVYADETAELSSVQLRYIRREKPRPNAQTKAISSIVLRSAF